MKRRSRLKLALITDEPLRRQTFKKRKRGMIKKLNELVTLCDIKACAIIRSPYQSSPEAWPSREGVEEIASKFIELPETERTKRMLNQEAYLLERIAREEEQVKKMRDENRESQLREFMFDCLKGNMVDYNYDAMVLRELSVFIGEYVNKITRRIEVLTGNNQPSSVPLHPPPIVPDATLPLVRPIRFDEQPHHRMIHGMNMYVNADSSQDQSLNMTLNSNQFPNHPLSFTELLTGIPDQLPTTNMAPTTDDFIPNMTNDFATTGHISSFTNVIDTSYVPIINNGIATTNHMSSFTTVDGFVPNITNDLATTGHMSFLTTDDVDDFVPNINNDLSTISHMPSITITNTNDFAPYINNDLSTIGHMPSITTSNDDDFAPYMDDNLYGLGGFFD